MEPRYYHEVIGINSRLDSIQAAVLRVKLPHLDAWTTARQVNASRYRDLFTDYELDGRIAVPGDDTRGRHVWNQFVIRVLDDSRDALRAHLAKEGVGTEIYYPVPLHLQKCFAHLGWAKGDLPETERAAEQTIALPIFPELRADEQRTVVARIAAFFGAAAKRPAAAGAQKLPLPTPHVLRRAVGKADDVRC
jgi:dTDP-4-amino-4,6-dideoxygalactose transaminase